MEKGIVKWFSNKKGFGFIGVEDCNDVFVHHSSILANGFRKLDEGEKVEFDIIQENGRSKAVNVKKVG